jgi:hypothetical protein
MTDYKKMSVEELRKEVESIRGERSGIGRVRRKASQTKRISGQISAKQRIVDAEKVESAEWI